MRHGATRIAAVLAVRASSVNGFARRVEKSSEFERVL